MAEFSNAANASTTSQQPLSAGALTKLRTDEIARWGVNIIQTDELDDWTSEWEICKKTGGVWGGRKVRSLYSFTCFQFQ